MGLNGEHPPNRQTREAIDGSRSMSLEQTLRKVVGRLNSGDLDNEAQVKSAVVLPVLRELGWDDADPNAFKPEFAVDRRFVDYALLDHGNPRVFIEAKHVGAKVGKGEDQLFGYASNRGVPLLVLTNGWCWDFYLSMAEGLPADRRFYSLDLHLDDKTSDYVDFLEQHLRKARVVSGRARLDAEELLRKNRKRERARHAIPDAWRALVEEPDEMLRDLLAEKVENECGAKPDLGDVGAFLASLQSRGPKTRPKPSPVDHSGPSPTPPVPKGTAKIRGFVLTGHRVECKSAIDTLEEILKTFQHQDSGFMDRLAQKAVSRTRRLLARRREDLYDDGRYVNRSRKLENDWWLGTNHSVEPIRRHIKTACGVAGIKFGEELKLIEE